MFKVSWVSRLLNFMVFENILKGQTIKISLKMGHFSVFRCTGAKPFIIAHHGFHHSVAQGLKYLGYQGYIYTHSPLRGSQLSSKKPRKQYFSRLCQKVDFVGLFSRSIASVLARTARLICSPCLLNMLALFIYVQLASSFLCPFFGLQIYLIVFL